MSFLLNNSSAHFQKLSDDTWIDLQLYFNVNVLNAMNIIFSLDMA